MCGTPGSYRHRECLHLLIVSYPRYSAGYSGKTGGKLGDQRNLTSVLQNWEGSSCCCERDTGLYLYPSLRKKKAFIHLEKGILLYPRVQVETHCGWGKNTLYLWGKNRTPSGAQTIRGLLPDILKKNYETHKKARKTSLLSRNEAINRARLELTQMLEQLGREFEINN